MDAAEQTHEYHRAALLHLPSTGTTFAIVILFYQHLPLLKSHGFSKCLLSQYRIVLSSNGFRSGRSDKMRAAMPARCGAAQLVAGSFANGPNCPRPWA